MLNPRPPHLPRRQKQPLKKYQIFILFLKQVRKIVADLFFVLSRNLLVEAIEGPVALIITFFSR